MTSSLELYFFSGTGNSLFLSMEIKKRISDTVLIPIATKREKTVIPRSKRIGFCFPNHGGQIPVAMKLFIQKLDLQGDEYVFALVSSGGTGCNAFGAINRIIEKKGLRLRGEFLINVPSFNPKTDDVSALPSEQNLEDFMRRIPEKLDRIAEAIVQNKQLTDLDSPPFHLPVIIEKYLAPFVLNIFESYPALFKNYFYTDSGCTGCGVCERICLTDRIKLNNGRPEWDSKVRCYICHACLAFCPAGAIQVKPSIKWAGSKTKHNPRFKPPFASIEDISRQKREIEYC